MTNPCSEYFKGGSFQQYTVVEATSVFILPKCIPKYEMGCMSFVDPLIAMGLFERIQKLKAKSFIQTNPNSPIGRYMMYLCKNENI